MLDNFGTNGFNPSEKYCSVGIIIPIYGKIKFKFQTTNQICMIATFQTQREKHPKGPKGLSHVL
jgi:hypothetical protein